MPLTTSPEATDRPQVVWARNGAQFNYEVRSAKPQPHQVDIVRDRLARAGAELVREVVPHTYNCAGMVLVNRRGWLLGGRRSSPLVSTVDVLEKEFGPDLERFLECDGYQKRRLDDREIAVGDLTLYGDAEAVEHVGVVVRVEDVFGNRTAWVLSKLGNLGEYLHESPSAPEQGNLVAVWTFKG